MKKFMKAVWILATSALAFSSCVEEQTLAPQDEQAEMVTIQINAGSAQTKTHLDPTIDGPTTQVKWDANGEAIEVLQHWVKPDQSKDYLNRGTSKNNPSVSNDGLSAKFTADVRLQTSAVDFWAVYPNTGYYGNETSPKTNVILELPDTQSPLVTSFDPKADLLISDKVSLESCEKGVSLDFNFSRPVAIMKMLLKGIHPDEKIYNVTFKSSSILAGKILYSLEQGMVLEYGHGTNGKVSSITCQYDTPLVSDGQDDIYFTIFPTTLKDFEVIVNTNKARYTKKVNIEGRKEAKANELIKFTVNLQDRIELDEYVHLTDVTKLSAGAKLIITATNSSKESIAMGAQIENYRSETPVTILGNNTIVIPRSTTDSPIQVIELLPGNTKNTFKFLVGANAYLSLGKSKNSVSTTSVENASDWTISIENTKTKISTNSKFLQYNQSAKRFACYTGGQIDPVIYYKPAVEKTLLKTPSIQNAVPSKNTIKLSWSSVANVGSYLIKYNGEEKNVGNVTEYTLSDLQWSTEYTISVTALPADNTVYAPSLPSESSVVTTEENTQPTITFTKNNFSVDASATSLTIPFTRNKHATGDVTAEVTAGSDWLTVSSTTIAGTVSEISCKFSQNTDAERTATIIVTYKNLAPIELTVTQNSGAQSPETFTVTHNFGKSNVFEESALTQTWDGFTWTLNYTPNAYLSWTGGNTPHQVIGSSKKQVKDVNLSIDSVPGNITEIKVETSCETATLDVKVNGSVYGQSEKLTGGFKNYTFTGNQTGAIELIWSKASLDAKQIKIKSVSITYLK